MQRRDVALAAHVEASMRGRDAFRLVLEPVERLGGERAEIAVEFALVEAQALEEALQKEDVVAEHG